MRFRAKVDANHGEVVAIFRAAGWKVLSLAQLGKGVPDLLCAKAKRVVLVEVKDGAKRKSSRRLTPDEIAFCAEWEDAAELFVVENAEDALFIIGGGPNEARSGETMAR